MKIPKWLQENNLTMCPCGCIGKKCKKNFLEKTIIDFSQVVREAIFSEQIASKPGILQEIDPRAKVFSFSCLILAVAVVQNPLLLLISYGLLIFLALLAQIPFALLFKRGWFVVLLFTGVMLIPSLFNWVRPGDTLLTLWNYGQPFSLGPLHLPDTLSITKQGLKGSLLMLLRVADSVTLALLLTLTTKWCDLLKALRILLIPKLFITTLEMTYRYIFVLLTIAEEMFLARKARTISGLEMGENRRYIGNSVATLFGKSHAMSEEVYAAMQARGYTGEVRTVTKFNFSFWDFIAVILAVLFSLLLYVTDKAMGGSI